jgi:hypothetical protein
VHVRVRVCVCVCVCVYVVFMAAFQASQPKAKASVILLPHRMTAFHTMTPVSELLGCFPRCVSIKTHPENYILSAFSLLFQ